MMHRGTLFGPDAHQGEISLSFIIASWLHIVMVIFAVGWSSYVLIVLLPNSRRFPELQPLLPKLTRGVHHALWTAIVVLTVTGVYSFTAVVPHLQTPMG